VPKEEIAVRFRKKQIMKLIIPALMAVAITASGYAYDYQETARWGDPAGTYRSTDLGAVTGEDPAG
jgi:hypothetical protein